MQFYGLSRLLNKFTCTCARLWRTLLNAGTAAKSVAMACMTTLHLTSSFSLLPSPSSGHDLADPPLFLCVQVVVWIRLAAPSPDAPRLLFVQMAATLDLDRLLAFSDRLCPSAFVFPVRPSTDTLLCGLSKKCFNMRSTMPMTSSLWPSVVVRTIPGRSMIVRSGTFGETTSTKM